MDAAVVTDLAAFRQAVAGAASGDRVPVEVRLQVEDPFDAYRRARDGTGGAYLETTGGQPGWGYFGVDPVDDLVVTPGGGPTLDVLASRLAQESLARGECDVPYPCGAVGWLSYDVARELEDLPDDADRDRDVPRLQMAIHDRLAAWATPRDGQPTLRITACPVVPAPSDGAAVAAAYARGRDRAMDLVARIQTGDPAHGPAPASGSTVNFESESSRAAFEDRVRAVQSHIHEGETFQANVSQRLRAPAAVHPVAAFAALRDVNPAPYSALLEFDGLDLVSASPELLLERVDDRLRTEPIAGTRPRGATDRADADLERDLLTDQKERAEHAMLVDLERNDLGKVCTYGSVEVSEYRRVDRYAEVMHLVSEVEGRLRPGCDVADAIAAVFPGGTVTGAPKPRTMELIDAVEPTRRGPYTGSIGLFGFDQRATLNIVIRTLVRLGDAYTLRVGAGIVHDSEPGREYAETLDKARALVTALDGALGDCGALELDP